MDLMTKLRAQWDRSAAAGCAGLGGLFLVAGWFGTSGTTHIAAQIPYMISAGIGGMFLLALGATLWLSADLRDQWRELRRLRVAQEALLDAQQKSSLQSAVDALALEVSAEAPRNSSRAGRRRAVATS